MSRIVLSPVDPSTIPNPVTGTCTMIIDINDNQPKLIFPDGSLVPFSGAPQFMLKKTKLFSDFTGSGYIKEITIGQVLAGGIIDISMLSMVLEWLTTGFSNVKCQLIIRDSDSDFNFDVANDIESGTLSKDRILLEADLSSLLGSNTGITDRIKSQGILNRDQTVDVILKLGVDVDNFETPAQLDGSKQVSEITTVADVSGSLASNYFLITSDNIDYYVWYNTGSDPDPTVVGRTGIEVSIDINDSADVVAYKTAKALYASAGAMAILAVSSTLTSFSVLGDQTAKFETNSTFNVTGSTGNDGKYKVVSSIFDGVNTIITVPFINSFVADGDINTVGGGLVSQSGNKIRIVDASTNEQTDIDDGDSGFTVSIKTYGGKSLAVNGINPTLSAFSVLGNKTSRFQVGSEFNVTGSTGNDGTYTVSTSFFDGVNTIIVVGTVPDATADGNVDTLKKIANLSVGSLEVFVKYSVLMM